MAFMKTGTIVASIFLISSSHTSQLPQYQEHNYFELFQLAKEPSTHKNQVNTFATIQDVYDTYKATTHHHPYGLAALPLSQGKLHQIGHNEIMVTVEYQEEINGKLRALIAGHGWKPAEQFASFRKLFLSKNEAEIKRLQALAHEVAAWQGFTFAAQSEQLGLEFFTEWTHTGSRMINNLNAFFFAAFLGDKKEIASDAWEQFTQTAEYKTTEAFRTLIEDLVRPVLAPSVGADQEGMSISTALQDFRRKVSDNLVLPQVGSMQTEKLFADKFPSVKTKYDHAKASIGKYASVEAAYHDLKAHPQGAMVQANNIRREIGGTGFLVALQQAIKSGLISEDFYCEYKDLINHIAHLTNEMDRCNFEINLGFGTYEGDAIPSPYAFFEKLSKASENV